MNIPDLLTLILAYARACRRDGNPAWESNEGIALKRAMDDAAKSQPSPAVELPVVVQKFWLWKNFVDGRPEYLAFDNPYPINLQDGDPQTLGEPCGYAIFNPARNGRPDVSEARVLAAIAAAQGAKS